MQFWFSVFYVSHTLLLLPPVDAPSPGLSFTPGVWGSGVPLTRACFFFLFLFKRYGHEPVSGFHISFSDFSTLVLWDSGGRVFLQSQMLWLLSLVNSSNTLGRPRL